MRDYTGMYIIRPTLTEEGYKSIIADINSIFEKTGSTVAEVNEMGIRDLAYEINDFRKGYYVKFKVQANNEAVAEYNRICNIKEDIIRHILVKE